MSSTQIKFDQKKINNEYRRIQGIKQIQLQLLNPEQEFEKSSEEPRDSPQFEETKDAETIQVLQQNMVDQQNQINEIKKKNTQNVKKETKEKVEQGSKSCQETNKSERIIEITGRRVPEATKLNNVRQAAELYYAQKDLLSAFDTFRNAIERCRKLGIWSQAMRRDLARIQRQLQRLTLDDAKGDEPAAKNSAETSQMSQLSRLDTQEEMLEAQEAQDSSKEESNTYQQQLETVDANLKRLEESQTSEDMMKQQIASFQAQLDVIQAAIQNVGNVEKQIEGLQQLNAKQWEDFSRLVDAVVQLSQKVDERAKQPAKSAAGEQESAQKQLFAVLTRLDSVRLEMTEQRNILEKLHAVDSTALQSVQHVVSSGYQRAAVIQKTLASAETAVKAQQVRQGEAPGAASLKQNGEKAQQALKSAYERIESLKNQTNTVEFKKIIAEQQQCNQKNVMNVDGFVENAKRAKEAAELAKKKMQHAVSLKNAFLEELRQRVLQLPDVLGDALDRIKYEILEQLADIVEKNPERFFAELGLNSKIDARKYAKHIVDRLPENPEKEVDIEVNNLQELLIAFCICEETRRWRLVVNVTETMWNAMASLELFHMLFLTLEHAESFRLHLYTSVPIFLMHIPMGDENIIVAKYNYDLDRLEEKLSKSKYKQNPVSIISVTPPGAPPPGINRDVKILCYRQLGWGHNQQYVGPKVEKLVNVSIDEKYAEALRKVFIYGGVLNIPENAYKSILFLWDDNRNEAPKGMKNQGIYFQKHDIKK